MKWKKLCQQIPNDPSCLHCKFAIMKEAVLVKTSNPTNTLPILPLTVKEAIMQLRLINMKKATAHQKKRQRNRPTGVMQPTVCTLLPNHLLPIHLKVIPLFYSHVHFPYVISFLNFCLTFHINKRR